MLVGGQFWLSKQISSVFRLLKIMLTLDTDHQNSNTSSFLTQGDVWSYYRLGCNVFLSISKSGWFISLCNFTLIVYYQIIYVKQNDLCTTRQTSFGKEQLHDVNKCNLKTSHDFLSYFFYLTHLRWVAFKCTATV